MRLPYSRPLARPNVCKDEEQGGVPSKLKAALGDSSPHMLAINAVLIISYLVLNITMNMLNKFLLGMYGAKTTCLTLAMRPFAPCDIACLNAGVYVALELPAQRVGGT